MNRIILSAVALAALILSIQSGRAHAGDIWGTDGDFLDDGDNAKVQRSLAQQRALEANMTAEELEESQERRNNCGSLDVGSVRGGGRKVENVTVIKGDVINVAGQCRSRR